MKFAYHMQGVTLIELMIGLTIIALLLGLGVPSYGTWIHNTQIRSAAESIQNGLQLARAAAVSRNTRVQLTFNALPASTWTVSVVASGEQVQRRSQDDGSPSVIVAVVVGTTTTSTGTISLTFNGLGRLTAPTAAVAINVDSSVLAAAESRDLRVAVGVGGDVRMCDPNVSAGDPRACS